MTALLYAILLLVAAGSIARWRIFLLDDAERRRKETAAERRKARRRFLRKARVALLRKRWAEARET